MNNLNPLVSVIIPVYNVEHYVEDCISSVIEQTYANLEIVIVDDCGTDSSMEIVEKQLKHTSFNSRILKHEQNRGLSAARNTGATAATGAFLYFLDSDDKLDSKCIEILVDYAIRYRSQVTTARAVLLHDDGSMKSYWEKYKTQIPTTDLLGSYIENTHAPTAWNKLINAQFYRETGLHFIEGILHEDNPWSFQLAKHCKIACVCNEVTYYYRLRSGSIMDTTDYTVQQIQGKIEGLRIYYNEMILNQDSRLSSWYTRVFYQTLYDTRKSKLIPRKAKKTLVSNNFNQLLPLQVTSIDLAGSAKLFFFLKKFISTYASITITIFFADLIHRTFQKEHSKNTRLR